MSDDAKVESGRGGTVLLLFDANDGISDVDGILEGSEADVGKLVLRFVGLGDIQKVEGTGNALAGRRELHGFRKR